MTVDPFFLNNLFLKNIFANCKDIKGLAKKVYWTSKILAQIFLRSLSLEKLKIKLKVDETASKKKEKLLFCTATTNYIKSNTVTAWIAAIVPAYVLALHECNSQYPLAQIFSVYYLIGVPREKEGGWESTELRQQFSFKLLFNSGEMLPCQQQREHIIIQNA